MYSSGKVSRCWRLLGTPGFLTLQGWHCGRRGARLTVPFPDDWAIWVNRLPPVSSEASDPQIQAAKAGAATGRAKPSSFCQSAAGRTWRDGLSPNAILLTAVLTAMQE